MKFGQSYISHLRKACKRMLGNVLSNGFCTMASKSLLFETCLIKVLPMNLFTNIHVGRYPFPNQIKFIYNLVTILTAYTPWCLTLEKHTPPTHDLEWRERTHSAVMSLPRCIKAGTCLMWTTWKRTYSWPAKERGERNTWEKRRLYCLFTHPLVYIWS